MAGGGRWFRHAPQKSFAEIPEIELPDRKDVKEESALVVGNLKLLNHWKSSAYYLEESSLGKKSQNIDVERFSDWGKPKATEKRDALSYFLRLTPTNFPKELVSGAKRELPNPKRVRWNPNSDLQKWDLFEKLEEKFLDHEEKGKKEKKESDEEGDDEDDEAQESEEEFSDDDYNQNIEFDDDEDDYNDMDDGNNDEPEY